MKKIIVATVLIALTAQTASIAQSSSLQTAKRIYHGISIDAGGGVSTMFAKSINANFKDELGYNTMLGLHYALNFDNKWALLFGLNTGYIETVAAAGNLTESRDETTNFNHPVLTERSVTLAYTSNLQGLKEINRMLNLQGSIMARYQTSTLVTTTGFYLAFGVKIGYGLWNSYKAQASSLQLACDYPAFLQHFEDIKNFGTVENISREGSTKFSVPNTALTLELGIKQELNTRSDMYLGVFVNYGLSSVMGKSDNLLVSFESSGGAGFSYSGFLNSSVAKRGSIDRLQAGIKLGFTFNFFAAGGYYYKVN
jgi:hypothetical protein